MTPDTPTIVTARVQSRPTRAVTIAGRRYGYHPASAPMIVVGVRS